MRFLCVLFLSIWGVGLLSAQTANSTPATRSILSFDPGDMDTSANACTDFYQYACGGWMAKNPIPPDQARWGRFNELAEKNRAILRQILEAASNQTSKRSDLEQKYGDFYASCMDEKAANAKGAAPLQPQLALIEQLNSKDGLAKLVAMLHSRADTNAIFQFSSGQDYKDATQEIAQLGQGGLGLPDRDYYTRTDARSQEIRKRYLEHLANMFRLMGDAPEQAATEAQAVMKIEMALASGSLTRTERRDPANTYHKMEARDLATLAPSFDWQAYLADSGAPPIHSLNVEAPGFLKAMDQAIQQATLAEWKSYLRWHTAHQMARFLSDAFVQESFNFYDKFLNGQAEQQPRWKRCVALIDSSLGEAVGQAYVKQNFGPGSKDQTEKLVAALEHALAEDIQDLSWMTPETKAEAEKKLAHVANKIGYPKHWRDYSSVKISRDDLIGNIMHANHFEFQRELNKIGKPVDREEWFMSPATVNAYYDQTMNDINFPAGILQPPFFGKDADEAMNYGGIGVVIGHELTHGFDDQGRKFDEKGNLRDWWTPADAQAFQKRADCLVDEYSQFSPVPDVYLNGKLTLGENTADNGGLRLAYMGLMKTLAEHPSAVEQKIDGFTPEQRYFLSFAQVWCENRREAYSRQMAIVDPHSPGKFRVIGTIRNNENFAKAFSCKAGQPMVAEKPCRVW